MKIKNLFRKAVPYAAAVLVGSLGTVFFQNYDAVRDRLEYGQKMASVADVRREFGEIVFEDKVLNLPHGFKSTGSLEGKLNSAMERSRHFRRFLSETDTDRNKIITSREIDAYLTKEHGRHFKNVEYE